MPYEGGNRTVFVTHVVGIQQISERLKVTRGTVQRWIERRNDTGFPTPIATVATSHAYDMFEVQEWFKTWKATRRRHYPDAER